MLRKERFGKLVLLDEVEAVHLGATHRAARLGPSGLDRIVTLLRYAEAVSAQPEAAARLMDHVRRLARLQVPGIQRVLGIGRVGKSYYASYEPVDGRSLRAVIGRAREEGFPFSAENALMVASRAASVLEALHARTDEAGAALFHGLVTPSGLVVSWEGEVWVREIGLWASLRETSLLGEEDRRSLAPEQAGGEAGDGLSDVHALGLVLLEILASWSPDGSDPLEALSKARFTSVTGEQEPLPPPIEEVLRRALASDPSSRYAAMGEMRQAIDSLLFSGDFTPTTFNLAFFMQTLFREDMERDAEALEEARRADYTEFLPAPPPASVPDTTPESEPAPEATPEPLPEPGPGPPAPVPAQRLTAPPPPAPAEAPKPAPAGVTPAGSARDPDASDPSSSRPRPAARRPSPGGSGRLFVQTANPPGPRRGMALLTGLVLALVLGGGGSYLYYTTLGSGRGAPPPSTLSPEAAAALARVRELEERLAELEREKAAMEADAGEDTSLVDTGPQPEAPLATAAPVPAPDAAAAAAAAQARAAARRRARTEAARREEQIRLLEAEILAAQSRLVAEQGEGGAEVDLAGALPAMTAPLPTPEPLPPPTTLPAVLPGQIVDADDPGLSGGDLVDAGPQVRYPTAALKLGREADVLVEALVAQDGSIVQARALESSGKGMGFEAAAVRQVEGRRYRPATKSGVPVRVRIRVRVLFTK